ncbi:unnamed protein product [Meganyctiphanes norvegica]|uniref:Uncharacterized protein n=1 Tax=Meganyctiphanes norvegica TaxID=48144 RepID=A0AAV2QA24_MEGNR
MAPMGAMKSFADGKVMEACIGQEATWEIVMEMYTATEKCMASPQDNEIQLDFSVLPLKPDGTPNFEECAAWIKAINITEDLRDSLLDAHNVCKGFSDCAPVDTVKCPITRRFGRIMAYRKCFSAKFCEACMMEDKRMMMSGGNKINPMAMKMMMNLDDVMMYGNVMKALDME